MIDIEKLLDKAGIAYETDEDGDCNIIEELAGGRTQLVIVCGKTDLIKKTEIVQVWTKAASLEHVSKGDFKDLLQKNGEYHVGAWEICGQALIFCVRVPISAVDALEHIIKYAALTADEMEKQYSDEDIN